MCSKIKIIVCKVEGAEDISLPQYMTSGAAGMDLAANVSEITYLEAGEFKVIPCGIKIEIPTGFEAQIRPRSGLAVNHGITVLNSPGTIDCDYRGELKVILINHGKQKFAIKRGDRIAQLVIAKVVEAEICQDRNLCETERGNGGFGHTGM
ncbi:dUTP diphosphatase [Tepidanaerobacter acetatoxydans]|uniref:dUTP diphosphatase n=1 Tax=Tepidanaerobacter acetatoxydans TaxID=499229 RepID=UPI001BD34951|nr:dUTP diphosphatase [Tepidanaerobacter acetatoxydans]